MNKILYIIPLFLFSVILLNNVYGYTITHEVFTSTDEVYDYIEKNNYTLTGTLNDEIINNRNIIMNSTEYKENLEYYSYALVYRDKFIFCSERPYIYLDAIGKDYECYRIAFSVKFNSRYVTYTILSYNTSTSSIVVDSGLTNTEDNKFIYGHDLDSNNNIDFYPRSVCTEMCKGINVDLYFYGTEEGMTKNEPEFEFVPTYNDDYTSCSLKVNVINAPDVYTLRYVLTNSDEFYDYDTINGITITNNSYVKLLLFDENDTVILVKDYIESNLVSNFPSKYFEVDFDNSDKEILAFTPIMYNNVNSNYECYFSFSADNDNLLFKDNNNFFFKPLTGINALDWTLLENSHTYYIHILTGNCKVDLNFKIVNKTTGNIELQRSFTFNLSVLKGGQAVSSTTNGTQDNFFNSGGDNINISQSEIDNPFSGLNSNSSFEDISSIASETFTTFSALFSILPSFIWTFIGGILTILLILRVLGR